MLCMNDHTSMKKRMWNTDRRATIFQLSVVNTIKSCQLTRSRLNDMHWMRPALHKLTFGFRKPNQENVGVVDDTDEPGDQDNEDVANDDLGPDG